MLFSYNKFDVKENEWVISCKPFIDITPIEKMAVDCVFHDLNNGYFKYVDNSRTDFEKDMKCTYWCGDSCYVEDDVLRVVVNDVYYLFKYMYVNPKGRVVLVVVKPKDMWAEDEDLSEEKDDLEELYFVVEY